MFENPFLCPGRWYRANLHAHTTNSDGDLAPADAAEFYRQAGYQVLALTDHWHVSDLSGASGDFLIIPGAELHGGESAQRTPFHIVGLNLRARGKLTRPDGIDAQGIVDLIRADGGEAIIAHPYWSGLMAPDIMPLPGVLAVEVYNTGCDIEILRGFSMSQWDDLLTLGRDLGALAVDDGHHYAVDHGRAWTMIRAEELTVTAVMEALRRGRYYASIGPEIRDLRVGDGRVKITTSPVQSIALVATPGRGSRAFGRHDQDITSAEFPLPSARYCRLQAITRDGKMAWTNPIILSEV